MQVQNIQSNKTTFGYNSLLNADFVRTLESQKKNKAYYSYIKDLVLTTNKAERELREAEKKDKPYLQSFLIATFLPTKILLTNMINTLFPTFQYRKKEIESYAEEIKQSEEIQKDPSHWMNMLVATLNEHQKQDEAAKMADVLSTIMHEIFPEQKFDFSGLSPMFKQHYLDNEDEDVPTEFDDDIKEVRNLNSSIKLGKEKVVEYVPTPQAERGFDGLGGMKELKETLNDKIVGVLRNPKQAKLDNIEYGKKIPKGLLLYGPPGCGKTTVVEHLSTEAGVPLLKLESGSLKSSYWHETSKNIDAAFDYAESMATPDKPVLLMIDDADSFFTERNNHTEQFQAEELTTFLNRIQKAAENNVMVVATTNKYDIMDPAVRSRFDEQIYVGLPDKEARVSILQMLLNQRTKGMNLAENETEVGKVADKLEKFAIREIIGITNRAAMLALKDGRRDIAAEDYAKIIEESQNLKVKEELYKTNATRKPIGFSGQKTVINGPKSIG